MVASYLRNCLFLSFISLTAADDGDSNAEEVGWFSYLFLNKYFAIYMVFAIVILELMMYKQMKMKPKNAEEEARDKKFHAFNKTDAYLAEEPLARLILYPCTILLPLRFFGGWLAAFTAATTLNLLSLVFGASEAEDQGPLQRRLVYLVSKVVGVAVRFSASIIWTNYERPLIDYREYLGPDWKPSYDNASSKVANHQAWTDTPVIMQWNCGAFIAKDAVRRMPFVGTVATLCGSLYINRSSNEDRATMLKAIGER